MAYYDIGEIFQKIEEDMIASMSRNLKRHLITEKKEDLNYTMWQAEQLAALDKFKKDNAKLFKSYFSTINDQIGEVLKKANESGLMEQEAAILEAIQEGWKVPGKIGDPGLLQGKFFRINDRKLNALITATKQDMAKAETAMLRMSNDEYRKIIFNSQAYYNTGAGTLPQCVDMATKDFLSKGITCVEYANGARVGIDVYSRMALRTAQTRAYLQGESTKRDEWGVNTVIVNRRGVACPLCLKYVGKVFYDDVWGSSPVPKPAKYPLMSEAISGGLYHPNCKDIHTTYFEGISRKPVKMTQEQVDEANRVYNLEQRQRYNERQIRKYKRLVMGSVEPENVLRYREKLDYWKDRQAQFISDNSDVLKRRPELEKIFQLPDGLQYGHNSYDPTQDIDDIMDNSHKHVWVETIIKQPKCEEIGEKLLKCSICGEEKKESIPALGHDMKPYVTAPTCTKEGYTRWICNRKGCLHYYITDTKPALGHDYGDWVVTRQPTTTEVGRKQRVCKRCGKVSYSTIPKLKAGATPKTIATDNPTITMKVIENGSSKTHATKMKAIMDKAPIEVRKAWSANESGMKLINSNYTAGTAHYAPMQKGVNMNLANDALGSRGLPPYYTAFHEFGHNLDYLGGAKQKRPYTAISEIYKNKVGKTLAQVMKDDWDEYMNRFIAETVSNRPWRKNDSFANLQSSAFLELRKLDKKARWDISDMLEAISGVDYPLGSGHGSDYWKGRDPGKEAFAEMYSATVANPESLEQIKKLFPNGYKTFLEILEVIS